MSLKKHKDLIGLAAVIILIYGVLDLVGIGCPIKFVTGISCLGCGMTRAWLSVLKLDFSAALYYHPLFILPPIAIIVYFAKSKINLKIYKIIMLTMVIAFITMYLYRLIFTDGDIVVFEPGNNIIFRLLEYERK
ncbi:MAG: DUF2752 domain-containing protein [Firmicutes bacterium]|nr:DUF2752 domain-containing protein [Bacillota bacterium]